MMMDSISQNLLNLEGSVCLITGAGQGIGRQIAIHFADAGASAIIVNDYYQDRADAVAQEVRLRGCKALAIAADVTDRAAVTAMAQSNVGPNFMPVTEATTTSPAPIPAAARMRPGPRVRRRWIRGMAPSSKGRDRYGWRTFSGVRVTGPSRPLGVSGQPEASKGL